jgi:hypothetical protein
MLPGKLSKMLMKRQQKTWLCVVCNSEIWNFDVLLRAKKVGHQISVSFEKFDVVQALLSFF